MGGEFAASLSKVMSKLPSKMAFLQRTLQNLLETVSFIPCPVSTDLLKTNSSTKLNF